MKKKPDRAAGKDTTSDQPPRAKPAPLTPRPKLLLITSIIMGLWIVALSVMYFTTVYPHPPSTPTKPTTARP